MGKRIKIIVDDKIPFLKGVFEDYADIEYHKGSAITKEIVKNADAIITRTRTICNADLLENSSVKLITTATIGYDHIDTNYCEQAGIKWLNSPGCNSSSVRQYIASALVVLSQKQNFNFADKTIGVVGVGNVGSKVAGIAEVLGMKVLLCDPPRARVEGNERFTELDELIEKSDIITFHVPLNKSGIDKTYHLADEAFFEKFKNSKVIFNSSRGQVVKTSALKNAIKSGKVSFCTLDVWEGEPEIDSELHNLVDIGTPHIAGYSADGKANGTAVCVNAINNYFNLGMKENWYPASIPSPAAGLNINLDCKNKTTQEVICEAILKTYDIRNDDRNLRSSPETFEEQRGNYPVRREFHNYFLNLINSNDEINKIAAGFQFKLKN